MQRAIERSHPAFRETYPPTRRCGRFSPEEIRQLVPSDLREHGCPETVFLRILEGNARQDRNYLPTETELRAKAEQQRKIIEADTNREAAELKRVPVYNPKVWEA